MSGQDMHRDDGCTDSLSHPVASIALEEGCSRIEAALWALIAEGTGEDPAQLDAPVRLRIGRYVRDRRRGEASAATLLGLLRQVQPRPSSGWQAPTAGWITG